jgi:Ca2+-binding RTX toxin-like protein
MDDVQSDIEIVKGGAGNDILNASAIVTTDVVLIGNAGNDTLTGGSGNDATTTSLAAPGSTR